MKRIILNLAAVLMLSMMPATILAGNAYAVSCGDPGDVAKDQVLKGVGEVPGDCTGSGVTRAIKAAVEILSVITGAAALIAIIWSGFKYITSGGDASKVSNAKNTLIYAMVGLAVAIIAQVIVNVVLTTSSNVASCPSGQHLNAAGNCVQNGP